MAVEVKPCFSAGSMKAEEFEDEIVHFVMAARYGRHPEGTSESGFELQELKIGVTCSGSSNEWNV